MCVCVSVCVCVRERERERERENIKTRKKQNIQRNLFTVEFFTNTKRFEFFS